jgi:hypothetical protein
MKSGEIRTDQNKSGEIKLTTSKFRPAGTFSGPELESRAEASWSPADVDPSGSEPGEAGSTSDPGGRDGAQGRRGTGEEDPGRRGTARSRGRSTVLAEPGGSKLPDGSRSRRTRSRATGAGGAGGDGSRW